jgi:two-component system response regulator AlgR
MRILIVDDEQPARQRLASLIRAMGEHEVAGQAASGQQALEIARERDPEVALLDIRMPGMDGLETAARLCQFEHPPAIMFVTAYGDYALDAFDTAAIDYLLKPVRQERLESALERARRLNRAQMEALQADDGAGAREHILCRRPTGVELVPVSDVAYFRADQKYVAVHHSAGEDLIEESLKQLEDEFGKRFVRIHRQSLVARHRVVGVEKGDDGRHYARLDGCDERLEVSRRHLSRLRRIIKDSAASGSDV